ncbi:MAG: peptidase domain-containing ABC transporter, partial [Thermoanaerobaculia bacterium]
LVRRHLPGLARVLGLSLALQAAAVSVPLCVQLTLDRAVVPRQPGWLPLFMAAASLIAAGTILLSWLRGRTVQQLQVAIDRDLMTRFVDHLLRLPAGFFLQRQPGDLAQRVRTNATLRDLLSSRSVSAVFDALLLAAYLALMLAYSVRLALVVVAAAALRLGATLLLRESRQRILGAELAATSRESAALVEGLVGIEGLRASGSEARMLHRWAKFATQRVNATVERRLLESGSEQLMVFLRGAALAAVLWIGGGEILSGRMTLGALAALLTLESAFLVPLEDLLASLGHFQYLRTHLARLDDILGASPEPSGSRDPGRLRGAIRLEDVSFRYSRWAPFEIQGVSVDIRPGEKIALVGPSGAGKSTLARLLLGLLQPTEGTIRFDGHDLRELDLRRVRRQIGAVLQETFLFDGTVRANLALSAPRASAEQLERAARLAACDEVIAALADGYDTPIGEGGARLSGGQRQRLCLARALLGEPAILLLDEATSSLDRETELRVHRNLAAFGCTRIVIAHRLETVKDADRILVVQDGRIVQEGSYAGLAGQSGLFRDLVTAKESHAVSG